MSTILWHQQIQRRRHKKIIIATRRRRRDREERLARRHADRGWCTGEHALPVAATDGQLCGEHFLAAFGREVMPTQV